ncbi:MAG: hypothetical protein J07AB43_03460 [Candidatus Nanosalina sp. J07AB43]|nr:MAG: hypothetical protein J07AB43_03460 [Candidatus Nanosalina sp. J07AB43]
MAAINVFVELGYEIVKSTWLILSITAKYVLLLVFAELIYRRDIDLKSVDDRIRRYGKLSILGSGLASIPLVFSSFSYTPLLELPSQLAATILLSYLFWVY